MRTILPPNAAVTTTKLPSRTCKPQQQQQQYNLMQTSDLQCSEKTCSPSYSRSSFHLVQSLDSTRYFYQIFQMGNSSPFMTPECTPIRPEIVDVSTPWSDILLEELRTAIQFDPPRPRSRYGGSKGTSCSTRLRKQRKIIWLTAIMILGFLWALKRGQKHSENESKMIDKQKLDGLQFVDANHPSIRVGQLIHQTAKLRLTSTTVCWSLGIDRRWDPQRWLVSW